MKRPRWLVGKSTMLPLFFGEDIHTQQGRGLERMDWYSSVIYWSVDEVAIENKLTLPTASPTKPFISICKLCRKLNPFSGDGGSTWTSDEPPELSGNVFAEIILFVGLSTYSGSEEPVMTELRRNTFTDPEMSESKLTGESGFLSKGEDEQMSSARRFLGHCCCEYEPDMKMVLFCN